VQAFDYCHLPACRHKSRLFRDDVGVPARLFQFFRTGLRRAALATAGGAVRIALARWLMRAGS
jgi:hypothetical protein